MNQSKIIDGKQYEIIQSDMNIDHVELIAARHRIGKRWESVRVVNTEHGYGVGVR